MHTQILQTPIGQLLIQATDTHIVAIQFANLHLASPQNPNNVTQQACTQLAHYFEGSLHTFHIPLQPSGTPFQQQVWQQLLQVPYGSTQTYQHIAHSLHNPKLTRAVGTANGANPIAIVIPCHRIIGSSGNLVGYAAGIERKKWLLTHEITHRPQHQHLLF